MVSECLLKQFPLLKGGCKLYLKLAQLKLHQLWRLAVLKQILLSSKEQYEHQLCEAHSHSIYERDFS